MEGKKIKIWVIGLFLALFVGQFLVGGSVNAAGIANGLANIGSFFEGIGFSFNNETINSFGDWAIGQMMDSETVANTFEGDNIAAREDMQLQRIRRIAERIKELEKDGLTPEESAEKDRLLGNQREASNQLQNDRKTVTDGVESGRSSATLENILGRMFSWILYNIATALGWILTLVIEVMLWVATYNGFLKQEAVVIGWKITRDICNNFFIILLLVTAIGTMLRQQAYQWKAMLPKILIAAVLINFSMMFCGIMIDVSQVLTLTFASPLATETGNNMILASMGLPDYANFAEQRANVGEKATAINNGLSFWDYIVAMIFAIIMILVTLVVVVAFTAMLIYRIIMLWFLVILSPLPFLLGTFDKGKSYASQWWEMFTKNLIFGPVMMFFLFLSFVTMGEVVGKGGSGVQKGNALAGLDSTHAKSQAIGGGISGSSSRLTKMATPNSLINAMIIIGLLVGSLYMGQKIGGGAAKYAGQGLDFLKTRAKKYSGFNAGQRALKGNFGMVGKAATAIDDKLGARQKLYSGLYRANNIIGIPGTTNFLGSKIKSLDEGTKKRTNQYYADVASARGIDKMDEAQLRKLAMSRNKAESVAATQALMKKGYLSDGDDANRESNLSIIRETRKNLKGTELGDTFDDNLRKYNPNLALNTMYDKSGDINMEKLRSDLKTGKADIDKIMKGVDKFTLNKLQKALGGDDDAVAKFINEHSDDLTKTNKSMASDVQKAVWSGVTADTFKSRKIAKDEKTGEIIRGADGQPKMEDHFDEDARKSFLSFRKTTKAFQSKGADGKLTYDDKGLEAANKYLNKTGDKFLEEMEADDMTGDFMVRFGDKYSSKSLKEKFFEGRGKLGEQKMTEALGLSLENLADANNDVVEMIIRNNLAVAGAIKKEQLDKSGRGDMAARYRSAVDKMDAREISNIKWKETSPEHQRIIIDSLSGRQNTRKNLAEFGNDDLYKAIEKGVVEKKAEEKVAQEQAKTQEEKEKAVQLAAEKAAKKAQETAEYEDFSNKHRDSFN